MVVAITGATGFLGCQVIASLRDKIPAADILVLAKNTGNARDLYPDLECVEIKIGSDDVLDKLKGLVPDQLIHLAWGHLDNFRASEHFSEELPAHFEFLEALVKSGLKRVTVVGTCLEYGMASGALAPDHVTDPVTPYGHAKDALRRQLMFLRRTHQFELAWGRLFYVFGPSQSPRALWPQLKAAAERGDAAFDMSGGEQLRDYLPIEEAGRQVAELALTYEKTIVANICSGKAISVRSLVEKWIDENGWRIALNRGQHAMPDFEPMAFWGTRDIVEL